MRSRSTCLLVGMVIVALLFGCVPKNRMTRDEFIQQQASQIAPPIKQLCQYANFKLAGMALNDAITQETKKVKVAQDLENRLKARVSPLLSAWAGKKAQPDSQGTLIIKPILQSLRIVSGSARFWVGGLAGNSNIDMDLLLIEEGSNQTVGSARIQRSASGFTGGYSMGASDKALLDFVVDVSCQYLAQNYSSSKQPTSPNMPQAEKKLQKEKAPLAVEPSHMKAEKQDQAHLQEKKSKQAASQNVLQAEKKLQKEKAPLAVEPSHMKAEKQDQAHLQEKKSKQAASQNVLQAEKKLQKEKAPLAVEPRRVKAEKQDQAHLQEKKSKQAASQNMPQAEKKLQEDRAPLVVGQNSMTAAIQEQKSKPLKKAVPRLKLAILPWEFSKAVGLEISDEFYMSIAFDALSDAIAKTALFTPLYSYYQLDKKLQAKPINASILRKGTINNLWKKKSVFSAPEPNTQLIADIGKQLNVDAVLVYYIWIDRGADDLKAFLVDVNKNQVHRSVGDCVDYKSSEGYDAVYKMTESVFTDLAYPSS